MKVLTYIWEKLVNWGDVLYEYKRKNGTLRGYW